MTAVGNWAIREWLMAVYALIWSTVTVILTVRGSAVVEGLEWWGILGAGELAVWKIFAPPADGGSDG